MHADGMAQPADQRRQRLAVLIEREAAEHGVEGRGESLRLLSSLLSDAQAALRSVAGSMGDTDQSLASATDAGALVGRLVELAPSLSAGERAVVVRRLRDAGLAERSGSGAAADPGLSAAQTAGLVAALQHRGAEPVDPARVVQATIRLVEFVASLDQLVWNTWKAISPESAIKRGTPIRAALEKYICGEDAAASSLPQDLERLRQVTAALTAAVGQAGRQFAQRHQQRFAPAEIERAARDEGTWNVEARSWAKYQQLAAVNDVESMQLEIMAAVAAYAEALLRGAAATPPPR